MADSAAIILAAGKGTRLASDIPKPLHKVAGRPMISHVLAALASIGPTRTLVVTAPDISDAVAAASGDAEIVLQEQQFGTGHAVQVTHEVLRGFEGDVLVLFADTPLLQP